jgi:transposase
LRLALDGRVQAHHQLLLGELLDHLDYLDQAIHRVEVNITALVAKEEKAVELLLTLPATGPVTAAAIIAEIGTDMVRRIGGRQGVQLKLLGLLEKPMRTYLIPAQVA